MEVKRESEKCSVQSYSKQKIKSTRLMLHHGLKITQLSTWQQLGHSIRSGQDTDFFRLLRESEAPF